MSDLTFLALGYAFAHLLASTLVALLVLLICKLKVITAEAKATVLFAALMLSVAAPLLLPLHGTSAPNGTSVEASGAEEAVATPLTVSRGAPASAEPSLADAHVRAGGMMQISERMALLLVGLWLSGIAWQLGMHARAHLMLRRVIDTSSRSHALERRYRQLLPKGVEIRLSPSFGPAVTGIVRPKILLPGNLAASLPEHALRAVLLHEASHVRRHDLLAHAFQQIAESVFWWNPALRWLGTIFDVTREIACDIRASRSCETPADYADGLLTAIENMIPARQGRVASAALGVSRSSPALLERIDSIIEEREPDPTSRIAAIGALLSMVGICVAAGAVARPLLPVPAATPEALSVAPATAPVPSANREEAAARPTVIAAADTEPSAPTEHGLRDRRLTEAAAIANIEPVTVAAPDPWPAAERSRAQENAAPAEHVGQLRANDESERTASRNNPDYPAALEAAHAKYLATVEMRHREYTTSSEAKHQSYTATAETRRQQYIAASESRYRQYIAASKAKYQEYVAAVGSDRQQLKAALEAARLEYTTAAEAERREHMATMEKARREYTSTAEGKRREYNAAMQAARTDYERQLKELDREFGRTSSRANQAMTTTL